MKNRIAIVQGIRSPFCKSGTVLKNIPADILGAIVTRELLALTQLSGEQIDEVIFGNVCQPPDAPNIARVIALKAGLGVSTIAKTVQRNSASGMEAISSAAQAILTQEADIICAGGTESMSNIPLLFNRQMTEFFFDLMKSKTITQKIKTALRFRPRYLKPVIGLELGLTDPICGLNMGLTAEVLAKEFKITRQAQDQYALLSHQKAVTAMQAGLFEQEITPIILPPQYDRFQHIDTCLRNNQTIEALEKLKPCFDQKNGTVTAGNTCPVADGAAAVIMMSEQKAKDLQLNPLGYLKEYAYAGLEPSRMGLGPVFATSKLLEKTQLRLKDFELIEINESFSAQVLACEKAFGELNMDIVNVNGGAIALGHPVSATGTRLIISLLKEMRRQKKELGLAALCISGGQGAAFALEVD